MKISHITYLSSSLVLAGINILNIIFFQSIFLGALFGLVYIIYYSHHIGLRLFPDENRQIRLSFGLLILLSLLIIIASAAYYAYQLTPMISAAIALMIPIIVAAIPWRKNFHHGFSELKEGSEKAGHYAPLLAAIHLFFSLACFWLLFQSASDSSLRSPWEAVKPEFFPIYFLSLISLFVYIAKGGKKTVSLLLISFQFFLSLSVALIIYKIGYGFDPFIHRATEAAIFQSGFIDPKPLYYIGQYSLIVFLSHLLQVGVYWLDKIMLVLFTSIILPPVCYYALTKGFGWNEKKSLLAVLGLLLLPYTGFIATTPQGLANFFLLIIIFFSLCYYHQEGRREKSFFLTLMAITALAALTIHPLTGIPVFIFIALILFDLLFSRLSGMGRLIKFVAFLEIAVFSSLIMPLVFILNSLHSKGLTAEFNPQLISAVSDWKSLLPMPMPALHSNFHYLYDLVYLFGFNFIYFFLTASAFGIWLAYRSNQLNRFRNYLICFSVLMINYVLLKNLIFFTNLIDYERNNYAQRLLEIGMYFLIPFFLAALYWLIKKIFDGGKRSQAAFGLFFCLFISFSLYLSYPRNDDITASHGYSTSLNDIKAVWEIENHTDKKYIVLANQAVSAAAIKELGFSRYYNGYYFYPVPTGEELYQYYLEMVYEHPSKETMKKAMELTGVDEAYLVLNDYWWKFELLLLQAKSEADEYAAIGNGKIYIFKYYQD